MIELDELHTTNEAISDGNVKPSEFNKSCQDFYTALIRWKLWMYLGWNDIRMRYRGSALGPFWITLSMLIFIVAFSIVYSRLLHQKLDDYVPFLTAGYLTWILISGVLSDSCNTFIESTAFITEIKLPYTVYIMRLLWRHFIIFLHNLAVYLAVAVYFRIPLSDASWLIFPGLLLLFLNLFSFAVVFSILGAKYRDVTQVIASVIQVAFFVTPISWAPNMLGASSIVVFNPLNYYMELVRAPLLGRYPVEWAWTVALILSCFVLVVAFTIFTKQRRNIPFWL